MLHLLCLKHIYSFFSFFFFIKNHIYCFGPFLKCRNIMAVDLQGKKVFILIPETNAIFLQIKRTFPYITSNTTRIVHP